MMNKANKKEEIKEYKLNIDINNLSIEDLTNFINKTNDRINQGNGLPYIALKGSEINGEITNILVLVSDKELEKKDIEKIENLLNKIINSYQNKQNMKEEHQG
ncbi:MAG: hypothetical protein ACP5LH_03205 [Candidatus Micrarchaeia archaeon]